MKEKFLPIGTVVLLKNGKKEVMILSYGIMPQGEVIEKDGTVDGTNKFYEYGGCTYPEGLINSEHIVAFNHDQIERVCFMGYETEEFGAFNESLKVLTDKVKEELGNN